jgi:histidyl-tRNA synthetase
LRRLSSRPAPLRTLAFRHYAGNFPLWLAPEQLRILPIGDDAKLIDYSMSILNELRTHQVRAEIDKSSDNINGKIQRAEQMKVHTPCLSSENAIWKPTPLASVSTAKEIPAPNRAAKWSLTSSARSESAALRPSSATRIAEVSGNFAGLGP